LVIAVGSPCELIHARPLVAAGLRGHGMKNLLRRSSERVMRALLRSLEARLDAQHQRLGAKIERLEKRLDAAMAKGQAEARLLASRLEGRVAPRRSRRLGARIPQHAHELQAPNKPQASGAIPADSIVELHECSVCGHDAFTAVCEFNRFLLSETAPDALAMRADYALCHRCGVVFARRRPVGNRFKSLVEHFEETIGRVPADQQRGINVLGSRRLSEDDREQLRTRLVQPMFLSEVPRPKNRLRLPHLLRDRLAVAAHIEILGSLLTLQQPRVLEIRPRFGAIGGALRRIYGGETFALPLFEVQQFLVREVYGTCAEHLLDYDAFSIPYPGAFDLVVANHLITHAVHPQRTLTTIRQRLAPGGHLYLYNEPDEADFLESGKSIFNTLNAFHLQTFDVASLARALQSAGFEPVYIGHYHDNCIALARVADDGASWDPMSAKERARRVAKYAESRDLGILALPERLRGLFAQEWESVVQRAFAAKTIDFDGDGNLRILKR
jgi:SAM-dependent methyltransferase